VDNVLRLQMLPAAGLDFDCASSVSCESNVSCRSDESCASMVSHATTEGV